MPHRFSLGRRAGLLLPLSSVRGPTGDLGSYADAGRVARWLRSLGCTMWQLLPLNEVSPGQDSPYAASSSNALEPVYVDLGSVPDLEGLTGEEQRTLDWARDQKTVDFSAYRWVKRQALARAFQRFAEREVKAGTARAKEFEAFKREHQSWLPDWALYRAIHDETQKSWRDWPAGLRDREPRAIDAERTRLKSRIDELSYVQWQADLQWRKGRREANELGVKVVGDLPFMVAEDSADVWSLQRLFGFEGTVGVPPDAYSAEGQDWGLPVPKWDQMKAEGDPWLTPRAARAAELYDAFRVDHVVGLYRTYWRPLANKKDARFSPADEPAQKKQGERILTLMGKDAEVLAEDLGVVPDFVRASLVELGIPGTKVLRWENDQGKPRDPQKFSAVSLTVTGTHDTEPLATWWEALPEWERKLQLSQEPLRELKGEDAAKYTPRTHEALLRLAFESASDALLIPITEALGLRDRMNTPGTVGAHNWTWRLPWKLGGELEKAPEVVAMSQLLTHLATASGRIP